MRWPSRSARRGRGGSVVCAVPALAGSRRAAARTSSASWCSSTSSPTPSRAARACGRALRGGEARVRGASSRSRPAADLVRLASEQDAELVVCGPLEPPELERLLAGATCDVALAPRPELPFEPSAPLLVPFGGGRDGVGSARARPPGSPAPTASSCACSGPRPPRAAGTRAACWQAPRLRSSASPARQAEPVLVPPGAEGILAQRRLGARRLAPGPEARRHAGRARRAHDGAAAPRPRRPAPGRARARADADPLQLVLRWRLGPRRRGPSPPGLTSVRSR